MIAFENRTCRCCGNRSSIRRRNFNGSKLSEEGISGLRATPPGPSYATSRMSRPDFRILKQNRFSHRRCDDTDSLLVEDYINSLAQEQRALAKRADGRDQGNGLAASVFHLDRCGRGAPSFCSRRAAVRNRVLPVALIVASSSIPTRVLRIRSSTETCRSAHSQK